MRKVDRMILIGEGRSTWKGNKTHMNPARKGKFLEIILLTKKKKEVGFSEIVSFLFCKFHNSC